MSQCVTPDMQQLLPDSSEILYDYDADGNLLSLTPPGRPAHGFTYTTVGLTGSYTPPDLGGSPTATQYTYNLDRQLTQVLRPDSLTIDLGYDTGGRISTVSTPSGSYTYGYSPTTGHLTSLTAPDSIGLTYTYDGSLPTGATWTGTIDGSVAVSYNDNFEVITQTVNGGHGISFQYDDDGLLTGSGAMTLVRDAQSGLLTGTTVGTVTSVQRYSTFGELDTLSYAAGGTSLLHTSYTRDDLGRITQKVETVLGTVVTNDATIKVVHADES